LADMSSQKDPRDDPHEDRLLRIEAKIDALRESLNAAMLDFQKQIAGLDRRLTILEEEARNMRASRWSRRDALYLALVIATWVSLIVALLKP